jgi:hypothetical protein
MTIGTESLVFILEMHMIPTADLHIFPKDGRLSPMSKSVGKGTTIVTDNLPLLSLGDWIPMGVS